MEEKKHTHGGSRPGAGRRANDRIRIANTITRRNGAVAGMEEYIRLFNEKYSEPQTVANVELSASEKRYFELQNMSKVFPLDAEQEAELRELANQN